MIAKNVKTHTHLEWRVNKWDSFLEIRCKWIIGQQWKQRKGSLLVYMFLLLLLFSFFIYISSSLFFFISQVSLSHSSFLLFIALKHFKHKACLFCDQNNKSKKKKIQKKVHLLSIHKIGIEIKRREKKWE